MNIEDVKSDEKNVSEPYKKIFDKQLELVEKYKDIEKLPAYPMDLDLFESQRVIKDFKQRGMEEIAEAIEALQKGELEHFKEELIDALHFFVELNILVGKGADFFEIEKKKCKTSSGDISEQTMFYNVGVVAVKYGLVCNTLKNKPWKQTQVRTDQDNFYKILKKAFRQFITLLYKSGMSDDDIYNYYFRKHKVNEFRIRSKY